MPAPDFNRFKTTFHFEEPDRVPLGDFWADIETKEAFLGKKVTDLKTDLEFWHTAGFDFWPLTAGLLEPAASLGDISLSEDDTKSGNKRKWANEHDGLITSMEAFEKYPWPDPENYPLEKFEKAVTLIPKGMKMCLIMGKIYTSAWMLMGATNFFMSSVSNPKLVETVIAKIGEIQTKIFKQVASAFEFGCLFSSDDVAYNTGPFISPKFLRKNVFPWYEEIGHTCREKDMFYVCHSDGNMSSLLDDIVALGFNGFHPIQPNVMNIKEVKKKYYKKLCLLGNLDLDFPLTHGTVEEVRQEVRKLIQEVGPGGGYLLSTSNSWTSHVPMENYRAMIDAVFEYGKYPIK